MNRDELLDQLSQDVLAYVMHGTFPEHHFAQEIAPAELDERFHDYEMLIRLHFILRPDVVDFVETLPHRLRGIKTQTENVSNVRRGTIEGKINWSATYRERNRRNPHDESVFVCDNRTENYDIDENIVLKRLLALIHETLAECEEYLERDYEWVAERWKDETDLVELLRGVFRRNVHLTRIRDPDEYEPTERMLQRTHNSRQQVYRDAADLLSTYRATLAGEREAIAELLESTAIAPDDDETLFELFVLFRYISVLEGLTSERFELETIETGSQEVARVEASEQSIVVYHDSAARAEDLSFVSDVFEKEPESMSRSERIQYETTRVSDRYFKEEPDSITRSRRPDVIVLEIESEQTVEYLITEVKYSKRKETIEQGIEETLQYLAFLREDGTLVHDDSRMFGDGNSGVLVVRDLDDETAPLEEQWLLNILQASELESQLPRILNSLLEIDADVAE